MMDSYKPKVCDANTEINYHFATFQRDPYPALPLL